MPALVELPEWHSYLDAQVTYLEVLHRGERSPGRCVTPGLSRVSYRAASPPAVAGRRYVRVRHD